jgi:hypothetical protein
MNKILTGLIIAGSLAYGSWQMERANDKTTYMYNTKTGEIFHCEKGMSAHMGGSPMNMGEQPVCKEVWYSMNMQNKDGSIDTKFSGTPISSKR